MCSVHAKRDCAEGAAICVGRSVGLAGEYISRPGLAAWVPVVVAVVYSLIVVVVVCRVVF